MNSVYIPSRLVVPTGMQGSFLKFFFISCQRQQQYRSGAAPAELVTIFIATYNSSYRGN